MQWETPWFIDLPMNSEIGAYQDDFGDEDRAPRSRKASAVLEETAEDAS
jgi:hypothetical protein